MDNATEVNNEMFVVERFVAEDQWIELGAIPGAGNSIELTEYKFTDYSPPCGQVTYRLQQFDYDGTRVTSYPVSGYLECNSDYLVYPNPTSGLIHFSSPGDNPVESVMVYSASGNFIRGFSGQRPEQADLSDLPPGLYIVQLVLKNSRITERIILLP